MSLLREVTSKMNICKSRIITEDNIKINGSERVQYYFQVFRAVTDDKVVFFWLPAPNGGEVFRRFFRKVRIRNYDTLQKPKFRQ